MSASTQKKIESEMPIRCLVIQLARLGDTLQSLMALRAAKQLYPRLEIHLLTREKFSHAAKKVPWLQSVFTLPTETLVGPVITGEKNETAALGEVARWMAPLVKDPWDLVVNWSFSESSSYLTGLIPARVKLGYSRRRDSSFSIVDGWSHYVQAVVQGKVDQNIHLTDILTTQLLTALQIHAGDPANEGNSPVTSKGFFSLALTKPEVIRTLGNSPYKWVGIQLGAGRDTKTWNPKKWAKVAQLIAERHPDYGIVLLGGPEDLERAQQFHNEFPESLKAENRLLSFVGDSDFDLWAYIVSRCQWLFAADTAAIHLASVLGTRILNISIGGVRFLETGPYGNGHYIIQSAIDCPACEDETTSSLHLCGESILAEAAYSAWSYALHEWDISRKQGPIETHFHQLGWFEHLAQVRVYRSRIRSSQDGGGVHYEPTNKRALRLRDWSAMAMGHVARSWYCGWTPSIGHEVTRETIGPSLIKMLRELQESTQVLSQVCDQASKTAVLLNKKSVALKSEKVMGIRDREELRQLGKSLLDLEALIDRLAKTHPPLLAFSQMSKVQMHNLKGVQLADLGKETAECYRHLNEGIQVYRDWIRFTLELVKPFAVKGAPVSALKELNP